jgi:hypothetical protein
MHIDQGEVSHDRRQVEMELSECTVLSSQLLGLWGASDIMTPSGRFLLPERTVYPDSYLHDIKLNGDGR